MPWKMVWARSTLEGLRQMQAPPDVTPALCDSCKATWAVMPVFCRVAAATDADAGPTGIVVTDFVRCLHCGAQYEWTE